MNSYDFLEFAEDYKISDASIQIFAGTGIFFE